MERGYVWGKTGSYQKFSLWENCRRKNEQKCRKDNNWEDGWKTNRETSIPSIIKKKTLGASYFTLILSTFSITLLLIRPTAIVIYLGPVSRVVTVWLLLSHFLKFCFTASNVKTVCTGPQHETERCYTVILFAWDDERKNKCDTNNWSWRPFRTRN